MAIVKKKLELDSALFERLQEIYGNTVSLTAIVSVLIEELISIHDEQNVTIKTLTNKAARNAREALSLSAEIHSEDE